MTMQHGKWVAPRIAMCVFGLVAAVGPSAAHHSRAAYDTTVEVTIEGVVADVMWANPHVYLILDVAGPEGAYDEAGS